MNLSLEFLFPSPGPVPLPLTATHHNDQNHKLGFNLSKGCVAVSIYICPRSNLIQLSIPIYI